MSASDQVTEVGVKYLAEMATEVVPVGYKQTEVGVIPEDWDVVQITDVCDFIVPGRNKPKLFDGGIPWITTPDFLDGGGVSSSRLGLCISREEAKKIGSRVVPAGSVIMTCVGDLGITGIANQEIVINQQLHAFIPLVKIHSHFLLHVLKTKKDYFYRIATKTALPYLNKVNCNSVKFPAPHRTEQIAIANALSDVDALINELEKLIVKKQAIKTATMQQLLTGRTRLPQFALHEDGTKKGYKQSELGEIPEDWGFYLLDDVIESCSSGATPFRGNKSFYKGINRWITSGELNYCVINDTIEKISDEALRRTNLKQHPSGTFLMAITGLEAAGTRGACGIVGKPSTTNQSCMAIYPNEKLSSNYMYYWYVYNGEALAFKYCQGTKQLSYTAGLLKKIPLYLPSEEDEQTVIAIILSDMDAEIQTLQQRLSKTRQIKQGMMQELLTGKTRLKIALPETA